MTGSAKKRNSSRLQFTDKEKPPSQIKSGFKKQLSQQPVLPESTSIGLCPWYGSKVYDGKSSYYCSSRECRFCLWKKNKFLENLKHPMTKKLAQELLKKGRIHSKKLYSQRTGKMFEADLVLTRTVDKEGNPTSSIQLDFGRSVRK